MSIIRQTDFVQPANTPSKVQNLGENPFVYREILMAEDPVTGAPIPYVLRGVEQGQQAYRIPHGLSTDAPVRVSGNDGNPNSPISAARVRIPDVVFPLLVVYVYNGGSVPVPSDMVIAPIFDTTGATNTTGWFADEGYVYVHVFNGSAAPQDVAFVIYVEYTHSIIKNEVVLGAYYSMAPPR